MGNSKTLRVRIKPTSAWAAVTTDVLSLERVTIRRGRPDEAPGLTAASAQFVLRNATGNYTPSNTAGAYYPSLSKATPVEIGMGVPPAGTAARYTGVSSAANPTVVAEASGYLLSGWSQWGTSGVLTGPVGYTMAGSGVVGTYSQLYSGYKAVTAGTVGGQSTTSTGSSSWGVASVFVPGGSSVSSLVSVGGVVFGSSTGSQANYKSYASTFSWSAGDTLVMFISTSDDSNGRMNTPPQDDTVGCEWVLSADTGAGPGPRVQGWTKYCPTAGTSRTAAVCPLLYDFQDVLFQVWKVVGSSQWNPRFTGFLGQLSSSSDPSGRDVRCRVTAGSVLRRVAPQGRLSALRRHYTTVARDTHVGGQGCAVGGAYKSTGLLAYWPLEGDGQGTASPSPIPGVGPAVPTGSVVFGADSSIPASGTLPQINNGAYLTMPVPAYSTATNVAGQMAGVFKSQNVSYSGVQPLVTFMYARLSGAGTTQYIAVQGIANQLQLTLFDGSGTATLASSSFPFYDSTANTDTTKIPNFAVVVSWQPDVGTPTSTNINAYAIGADGTIYGGTNTTLASNPMGPVTSIVCGVHPLHTEYFTSPLAVGHIYFGTNTDWTAGSIAGTGYPQYSVVFPNTFSGTCAGPFDAWAGESPVQRMIRVCAEQGVPFQTDEFAFSATEILCGPQPPGTFQDILQDAATTDGGQLAEARGFAGLTYRRLGALGSVASKETFDLSASMLVGFTQVDDDQQTANVVTAQNATGGSATAALAGATDLYPETVGVTVSRPGTDLLYEAQWWLNVGTPTGPRFKALTVDLATYTGSSGATAVDTVTALDVGQRVTLTNTPVWAQPGPAEILLTGFVEVIGSTPSAEWSIELDGGPYTPFFLFRLDDAVYGILDTDRLGLNQ